MNFDFVALVTIMQPSHYFCVPLQEEEERMEAERAEQERKQREEVRMNCNRISRAGQLDSAHSAAFWGGQGRDSFGQRFFPLDQTICSKFEDQNNEVSKSARILRSFC